MPPDSSSLKPAGTGPLRWNSCTDILARTIWALGRHGGQILMHGLACALMNRARVANQHFIAQRQHHPEFGDGTIARACLKLPCWHRHDPDLPKMERVTIDDPDFEIAIRIAALACDGTLEPIVAGATHFISIDTMTNCAPDHWSRSMKRVRQIGTHVFLR